MLTVWLCQALRVVCQPQALTLSASALVHVKHYMETLDSLASHLSDLDLAALDRLSVVRLRPGEARRVHIPLDGGNAIRNCCEGRICFK